MTSTTVPRPDMAIALSTELDASTSVVMLMVAVTTFVALFMLALVFAQTTRVDNLNDALGACYGQLDSEREDNTIRTITVTHYIPETYDTIESMP